MKNLNFAVIRFCIVVLACVVVAWPVQAQLLRQYGTTLNESFAKVIPHGAEYYVLGQAEAAAGQQPRATVSRINAGGQLLWTRRLDVASQWNDAVLTPSGNLLLVGHTLPLDPNSQSLMGLITPAGAFNWLRNYNTTGRESFNRVVLNPMPDNAVSPYYVLGFQQEPNAVFSWDDVVLLTVSEAGAIGWKKIYAGVFGSTDDEFVRDLEALPNGDLLLAGNWGTNGVIFRTDNTGAIFGGVSPDGIQMSFVDVAQAGSNFIATGAQFPAFSARLMKFNADLITIWQISLPNLTSIRNVWTSGSSIYVSGSAEISGLNRGVVLKFQDGANAPVLQWTKYLEVNETSYTGGAVWPISANLMAYADGRARPDGFGGDCAFLSVSNLEMTTCMTQTTTTAVTPTNHIFSSPCCLSIDFADALPGISVANSLATWQQGEACPPCEADFSFSVNCNTVTFTNLSNVPAPASWQWSFPGGSPATSSLANPVVTYPTCGSYTACLIAVGAGGDCITEICKTITTTDNVPPVITCPQTTAVQTLPGLCYYTGAIPTATATDNCTASPTLAYSLFNGTNFVPITPSTQFPKGVNTIRCQATDICGNQRTCDYELVVNDAEGPELSCPLGLTLFGAQNPSGQCTAIVQNIGPGASDNCPMLDVQWQLTGATTAQGADDASGALFNQGITTVTYTATDMSGNVAVCSFTVDVRCPTANVQVYKYHDLDCDGTRDLSPAGIPIDTGLAGWWFALEDIATGEIFSSLTDDQGRVMFDNLAPGNYTVREVLQSGWTPVVPASGMLNIPLEAGQDAIVEFGNCLTCSCDGLDVVLTQEHEQGDTSAYYLTILNNMPECVEQISIMIESGDLLSAESLGSAIDIAVNGNEITLQNLSIHQVPYIKMRIHNSDNHAIIVNSIVGQEPCTRSFSYPSPPPVIPRSCCPDGTVRQGPNLVVNGNFNVTAPPPAPGSGYTTNYVWTSTGTGTGNFSVLNANQVAVANGGYWYCVDRSNSLTAPFMIVDGASNQVAWRHSVPVAPATSYSFEAWANNIVKPSYNFTDPIIELRIVDANNVVVASSTPVALSESPDKWEYICLRWTSPASLPVNAVYSLEITSLATDNLGNDFALDDISFKRCVNCTPLPQNPVAWWPMDETGGETDAFDILNGYAANSLSGTIGAGGPTPVVGKVDINNTTLGALQFSGPSGGGYLNAGVNPAFNFAGNAFTIDAWVYTNMTTQTEPIVDKLANQSSGYAFSLQGNPSAAFPTLAVGTTSGVQVFQGPPIAVGQWNFVAVAVSPASITFFVGGDPGGGSSFASLSHSLPSGTVITLTNNLPLLIGHNPLNPHKNIIIDELEIFNQALTYAELDKIWAADDLGKCRKTCPSQCVVNTIDISTGADPQSAGSYLAPGGVDPQWMLISAPPNSGLIPPQPANLIGAYPSWGTPPSTWISAFPFNNYGTDNCSSGVQDCSCPPYTFERRFCVCKTTQATFNFDFWSDNNGSVALWKEDVLNPGTFQLYTTLADNCASLDAVTNFTTPLAVNTTLTLPPGRYALRINNWNISGIAMGVNLLGTVTGLDLESDLCCADPVGALCVTKYHDLDCDGIRDISASNWTFIDPGLANWAFQITGPSGSFTGVTNQQGQVCFTNLNPGTYTVTETAQTGWVPSQPASGSTTVAVNSYGSAHVTFGNCTESCTCGLFGFLYSIGRGPLLPKNCGDVLQVPDILPFQFIPSFQCNGNCINPPVVDYVLTGPPGFVTQTGNGVPITALPIIAGTFTIAGVYHLAIIGHCDGNLCPCELTFVYPGDCCRDQQFFLANLASFVDVSVDNNHCKATLNIGNLPQCDYLEWVNWGDGSPQQFGPFGAGDMPMHTYATSGSYVISYLAIERDLITGLICFEQIISDTLFLSCEDSWCPLNVVQNGDFSVGVPTPGDQDICNALRWCGIWPGGSTGDFYNSATAPPPGAPPAPLSQGNYGAFWCRKQGAQTVWREGIMNELQYAILPNTGCYELTFKLACTGSYFGAPILNAYGVVAPGLASGTTPVDGNTPLNSGLFPAGALVQLGSHPIPITCNNNFLNPAQTIAFTVNSNTFPAAGITHIFFTRDDNTDGGVYLALDDVCLKPVACSDSCVCGGFNNLFVRTAQGAPSIAMTCGAAPVQLGCPQPGESLVLTGVFQCSGDNCPPEHQISWTLTRPNGSTQSGGFTDNDPFFGIQLLPTWLLIPGTYTLTMSGNCGSETCSCEIKFNLDCPNLCPCDPSDIEALSAAVNQGFSVVKYPQSCKACFAPVALSDCEEVAWHLNDANGPIIGNSAGGGGICHNFNSAGTYTVVMVVTRKRADGSICEVFVKSKTVSITCLTLTDCTDSVFPNASFAQGAVPGGMLSGGASAEWTVLEGEPIVAEGQPGSIDGWTIQLSGNFDTYDILITTDSFCLERDTGMIVLKMQQIQSENQKAQAQRLAINTFSGSNTITFVSIPLDILGNSEWVEVEIPYNLNFWQELQTCNEANDGVWVRPFLYVTNFLSDEQGGEDTYSSIQVDNFCMDGMLATGIGNIAHKYTLRLYPNPTTGQFTLELPEPALPGAGVRILGLTGQTLLQQPVTPGLKAHTFDLSRWPAGMYFLQFWQEGRLGGTAKMVRQ